MTLTVINDVYLRDLLTGRVTLVSKNSAGLAGNGPSSYATISSDGKRIAYQSLASDLVAGDTNGKSDVFLYTRVGGVTSRVSLTASNGQANDDSSFPALSSNGSFLAFVSKADLTGVGTAGIQNLYLRKVDGSSTKLFSAGSGTGANAPVYTPVITNDSRYGRLRIGGVQFGGWRQQRDERCLLV
jgi:Tol biopolymer transport system component